VKLGQTFLVPNHWEEQGMAQSEYKSLSIASPDSIQHKCESSCLMSYIISQKVCDSIKCSYIKVENYNYKNTYLSLN
jgi:hypothetical protein